jgi:hypothetical protein
MGNRGNGCSNKQRRVFACRSSEGTPGQWPLVRVMDVTDACVCGPVHFYPHTAATTMTLLARELATAKGWPKLMADVFGLEEEQWQNEDRFGH